MALFASCVEAFIPFWLQQCVQHMGIVAESEWMMSDAYASSAPMEATRCCTSTVVANLRFHKKGKSYMICRALVNLGGRVDSMDSCSRMHECVHARMDAIVSTFLEACFRICRRASVHACMGGCMHGFMRAWMHDACFPAGVKHSLALKACLRFKCIMHAGKVGHAGKA